MEPNATATATNPTDATATSTEAPTTSTATAATDTGKQTQTGETQTTQSTEKSAAQTTTTDPAAKLAAETKTAPVVPEKYEFKAPEGTEFDPAVIEAYSSAAKTAGLSQDAAQKLIETMAPALAARQAEQLEAIHEGWRSASAADKEIGGEKFQENLAVAKKAYENFASPELRKLLDDTGMGNHPEVLRMMFRVGKAISEDKVVGGRIGKSTATDPTAVLYPTMKKD